MSTYGLRVKNAAGQIQIDSTYRNMSYTEGATGVTITTGTTSPGVTNVNITDSALIPLILFRPGTDQFSCIVDYVYSGGTYNSFNMQTYANTSTTVDWRCYRQTTTNTSGYGLRIMDSNSNMVFHSSDSYFKIKSVNSISLSTPTNSSFPSEDITHSSDSNPYYILSNCGFYVTPYTESPPGFYSFALCRIGAKKLSSTSVRIGWFPFALVTVPGVPSGTGAGYNPTIKVLVCEI